MIAVRSWSANPFGEVRSHSVSGYPCPRIRGTPMLVQLPLASYLSGESISTVTLTSRILASTLPRNPGGTSS